MNTSEPQPIQEKTRVEPDGSVDADFRIGAGINFSDPNSKLAPYYLRTSHIIAFALLTLVFFYFGVMTQLAHTDVWGHLRYGKWIVENYQLPAHELFSDFSDAEQPYWNFQWLSQVTLYLVYHAGELLVGGDELHRMAGGVEMLRTLHGLLAMLKTAFVLLAVRRSTRSLPLAIAGAVLYMALAQSFTRIERPQVIGEVFFAALLWWLSGKQLSRATVVVVPLLLVVWANCHGSFVVGFVLLGAICAGRVIELAWRPRRDPSLAWQRSSWLWQGAATLLVAAVAVVLLNPHGTEIVPGIMQLAKNPNIRTVVEWKPLDFARLAGGHWIYLGTLVLVALSQLVSPRPLALSRVLVLIPFALGPLFQQRMVVWWVIVVPWITMDLWHSAAAVVPRFWQRFRSVPSLRKTMMAAVIVMIGVSWSGAFHLLIRRSPPPLEATATHSTLWPLAEQLNHDKGMPKLADALKRYPDQKFRGRIFAQDMLGDYLMWSLPGKAPVLVYNHAHVFPEGVWQDQITVLSARPSWNTILDRYQVNMIVFDPQMCHELADKVREDSRWQIVIDEGIGRPANPSPTVFNGKVLIALRKQPI